MSTHVEVTAKAETMNANTTEEFIRIFFWCPMGHDLGSVPLDFLLDHPTRIYTECSHYEHRVAVGQ